MRTVIEVENIGKQYRLGQIGTGTLTHDLNRWWHRVRGKEDPYLQIGETNDRSKKGSSDLVWALKDVNFDVQQGEVLGIIGKNGAGKSTLLKILSRVTAPTTGQVRVKGRIASLLEVGTGFHPELTGRENIFLNGAILGMSKQEIISKFDAIVDFSGVERYIDTPVKRYSSGMYVRLAFAVAAHLEPEILIVDEVLAVGDAEFQKKCLGKMKDVSGEGRTVLFVSHNMPSIRLLCTKCLEMEKGTLKNIGATSDIIAGYLKQEAGSASAGSADIPERLNAYGSGQARFRKAFLFNTAELPAREVEFMENFGACATLEVKERLQDVILSVSVVNQYGEAIMSAVESELYQPMNFEQGNYEIRVKFSETLMPGNYSLGLELSSFHTGADIDYVESVFPFTVKKESIAKDFEYPWATVHGYIKPKTNWQIKKI